MFIWFLKKELSWYTLYSKSDVLIEQLTFFSYVIILYYEDYDEPNTHLKKCLQ